MSNCFLELIFAFFMLSIGVAAMFFTNKICAVVTKMFGEKKGLPVYTSLSIRFGAAVAILMGVFVLWMYWRNC